MNLRLRFLAAAFCLFTAPAWAQYERVTLDGPPVERGFEGVITAGLNGSQIDGDGLSGFNMPGLYLGLGAKYLINKEWAVGPEFLYSQKGARTTIDDEGVRFLIHQRTRLHYVEMPVLAYYRPQTFRNMTFEGGLSAAYLFYGYGEYGNWDGPITSLYTKVDVSAVGGFEYHFSDLISAVARWTYSLNPQNSSYTEPNYYQIAVQGAGLRNNTISIAVRFHFGKRL